LNSLTSTVGRKIGLQFAGYTTTAGPKLSVTTIGSNPSFVVEDSTSPDTTPFIIDASGNVGIGTALPSTLSSAAAPSCRGVEATAASAACRSEIQ
jgi:hypothetical protein